MKVGFDISPLREPRTGIARYTYELLAALWCVAGDAVMPIGNRATARIPEAGKDRDVLGPAFPSRAAWTFGLLPFWLRHSRLDLFHATSYYAPLQTGMPVVVTVHDLSLFTRPELHPAARVLRARVAMPAVARRADAVIVPSRSVEADAVRWLGIEPGRVHVVPEAAADVFARRPAEQAVAAALARYGLEPGFFLAVGALEPRKNIARVVEAIEHLEADREDARLVVAGPDGWKFGATLDLVRERGLDRHVRFVGFVPDADLVALMSAAAGLVYASLDEGFGLPILEAMAAGLPVVTSDRGALAELAVGAALLVDPEDPLAIAGAMRRLLHERALRDELSARGGARAAQYSWSRTARDTLAVYESVAGQARAAA